MSPKNVLLLGLRRYILGLSDRDNPSNFIMMQYYWHNIYANKMVYYI